VKNNTELNKPISNPMLIGAIQVMKAENTPDHRKMFINELVKSKLLSPAIITPPPVPGEDGKMRLTKENKIQFPMLTAPDGKRFFMAFTDMPELKKWKTLDNQQSFVLTFKDYAGMTLKEEDNVSGFVLNPYGENLVISKDMIAALSKA